MLSAKVEMAGAFLVRVAGEADTAGILACLAAAFAPYRVHYTPEAFADTVLAPPTLSERLRSMTVLVAVSADGQVVGTVGGQSAGAGEGHLRGMAVLPAWAGRGVARELLAAIERELRARGCARITLDTTEPLGRAMRFYERHGYRRSGRVVDFFGMPLLEYGKDL